MPLPQTISSCLPDLLGHLPLPWLDMQETIWADIALKVARHPECVLHPLPGHLPEPGQPLPPVQCVEQQQQEECPPSIARLLLS